MTRRHSETVAQRNAPPLPPDKRFLDFTGLTPDHCSH
jgi:hypothetical protein